MSRDFQSPGISYPELRLSTYARCYDRLSKVRTFFVHSIEKDTVNDQNSTFSTRLQSWLLG